MDLHLVLLPMIAAVSLASAERCASSPGSRMDLSLLSQKNASGLWILTVNTQRSMLMVNQRELIVNVHQETRLCGDNEIEQLISMTTVYPSLHDSSMSGAIDPATPATTTTSRTTPVSCPRSGYQLFPEFNCYKAFPSKDEWKTWFEARGQCRRDGGDLMVTETERERKHVFIPLYNSVSWPPYLPWVGVYIPEGGNVWMTVKGEPALSTWWDSGHPRKDAARKCALAESRSLLWDFDCADRMPFICEIPL